MKQKLSWALGLALLATLALTVPVWAQAPQDPQAAAFAKAAVAVEELSKVWDTWAPIPNFKPEAYSKGPDGTLVKIGTAKGVHGDTEKYRHVDVVLVYAFGGTELSYVQLQSEFFEIVVVREENGKLTVIFEGELKPQVDAKGEAESFTISFTRGDQTRGSRTFTRPKPKTKA